MDGMDISYGFQGFKATISHPEGIINLFNALRTARAPVVSTRMKVLARYSPRKGTWLEVGRGIYDMKQPLRHWAVDAILAEASDELRERDTRAYFEGALVGMWSDREEQRAVRRAIKEVSVAGARPGHTAGHELVQSALRLQLDLSAEVHEAEMFFRRLRTFWARLKIWRETVPLRDPKETIWSPSPVTSETQKDYFRARAEMDRYVVAQLIYERLRLKEDLNLGLSTLREVCHDVGTEDGYGFIPGLLLYLESEEWSPWSSPVQRDYVYQHLNLPLPATPEK